MVTIMPEDNYNGPERRSERKEGMPLSSALTSVIQLQAEVETLARAVDSNKETQSQAQRKINMLTILAVALIGLFAITWSGAQSSKDAVHTLQDCLIAKGKCFTRLAIQGQQGAIRQIKFQACVLNMPPALRTSESTIACAEKAYPDVTNMREQLLEVLK